MLNWPLNSTGFTSSYFLMGSGESPRVVKECPDRIGLIFSSIYTATGVGGSACPVLLSNQIRLTGGNNESQGRGFIPAANGEPLYIFGKMASHAWFANTASDANLSVIEIFPADYGRPDPVQGPET